MGAFANIVVNMYIVKTHDWIVMLHFGKENAVFGFLRFSSSNLAACVTTDCSCKTTRAEDRHLVLTAILF